MILIACAYERSNFNTYAASVALELSKKFVVIT